MRLDTPLPTGIKSEAHGDDTFIRDERTAEQRRLDNVRMAAMLSSRWAMRAKEVEAEIAALEELGQDVCPGKAKQVVRYRALAAEDEARAIAIATTH